MAKPVKPTDVQPESELLSFEPVELKAAGMRNLAPAEGGAGYNLMADESIVLPARVSRKIHTGVCVEIPPGYVGLIRDRDEVAWEKNLMVYAGVIPSSYRGEIVVVMFNSNPNSRSIQRGQCFAQLLIVPVVTPEIVWVDELSHTEGGNTGE